MKKYSNFLLASSVILFVTSAYLGYRLYVNTIHPEAPPKICPVSYDYSNGDSVGIINYETAQALFENYKKDSAKAFISTQGKSGIDKFKLQEDTKSVWFSLDRLKKFLWLIENQNCTKGCNDTLGLRIYFAKYPDLNNTNYTGLENVPKNYSNQHTLFMVPTYKGKSQYNYDFYPGGGDCRTPLVSSPTHYTGGEPNLIVHNISPGIFLFDMSGAPPVGKSKNHGGLVPPNDSEGTSFQQ